MQKRVHKLVGFDSNPYKLLGISSHENDYRLSWALNRKLRLNFLKAGSIKVQSGNSEVTPGFSVFQCLQKDKFSKMNLISNRCPDGFLIKEMRNIDFFLQIFGDIDQKQIDNIIVKIKTIDLVSAVFEIKPEKIKKTWNLPPE
ncbi:MAG: IPExxxVDY family protein [Bacteroidales bacterium]